MKSSLIFLSIILLTYSKFDNDSVIYKNYCQAVDNYGSTYQNYLVVKFYDKSTKVVLEKCMTGSDFVSIMQDEWNHNYDKEYKTIKRIKKNRNRYFKVESVNRHSFLKELKYSNSELLKFSDRINFDSIAYSLSRTKEWDYFPNNEKEQIMLAHLLFNKGFLVGINECMGGEQLQYYNK